MTKGRCMDIYTKESRTRQGEKEEKGKKEA